jgi:hypothetical protein
MYLPWDEIAEAVSLRSDKRRMASTFLRDLDRRNTAFSEAGISEKVLSRR